MAKAHLILGLLLLTGCLNSNEGNNGQTTTDSGTTSQTSSLTASTSTPPAPIPPPSPLQMEATECVQSAGSMAGVPGSYGEQPPPGWENNLPVTFITDYIFKCERVSWGSIERPSYVLWEVHESFSTPDSCRDEGYSNRDVATLWFSDAALVEQAKAFGLPAFLGSFNLSTEVVQGIQVWDWRWNAESQPESSLKVQDHPPFSAITRSNPHRFIWFANGGVSYFDIDFSEEANAAGNPVATGMMSAPMMFANGDSPIFAGAGRLMSSAHFSGTIHRFSDLLCEDPITP
ncbi:MAG: hypothetical protein ACYC2H_01165 [Thermoplasmatota archaeon]